MKDNKLIAEFMGNIPIFENEYQMVTHNNMCYGVDELKYHTDWNWLMQVVEKILNISLELDSMETYYNITDSIPNIEQTHEAVIEFIKWYNEQNIMINKIYCDICSQASVETLQIITEETFYCCTMCRDNNEDREIKDNNFYEDCVIDYKS